MIDDLNSEVATLNSEVAAITAANESLTTKLADQTERAGYWRQVALEGGSTERGLRRLLRAQERNGNLDAKPN